MRTFEFFTLNYPKQFIHMEGSTKQNALMDSTLVISLIRLSIYYIVYSVIINQDFAM